MTTPTPAAQKAAEAIAKCAVEWNRNNHGGRGYKEAIMDFAAIIEREMNQWRPISEVPKDGTYIRLWRPIIAECDRESMVVGKWYKWREGDEAFA